MRNSLIAAALGAAVLTGPLSASAASYIVMGKPGTALDAAVRDAGGTITNRLDAIDALVVDSRRADFKSKLSRNPGVQAVVPNLRIDWQREPKPQHSVRADFGNPPNSGDDDALFNLQWGHDAVNAVEAWNAGFRGAGATVAVLDAGFNVEHQDIAPSIRPGCTADFTGEGLAYGPNEEDPDGIFAHGTHTSGTVAAADNGLGTIGVAPSAKLCTGKVLFNTGSGEFEDVVEGILWATDQDVDVIGMSLGGALLKSGDRDAEEPYTAREAAELKNFIARAVHYAYQNGTLVIASAGNEGIDGNKSKNLINLPSDAPHVLSICATAPIGWATPSSSPLDFPASYTNFGRSVISLAAPGGDFIYPGNENCLVTGLVRPCWVFDLVFSTGGVVGTSQFYYWSAGTSMAVPHAAGVAALAISRHGRMSPSQLRTLLERSADDLGQPGNDPFYGAGRVNAEKAVQ